MARKALTLNKVPVILDGDSHSYCTKDGVQLSGVTSLLERHLFAHKYDGVPKENLRKAADRGSAIHEEISRYIVSGIEPQTQEGRTFVSLGLNMIASEYLVSDMNHVATFIDAVEKVRGGVVLWDFKTNRSGADRMYLQWQLSVNAYLFSLVNPDIKIVGIKGLWLCEDKYEVISFDRMIPREQILDLIESDAMGLPYINPYDGALTEQNESVASLISTERKLAELQATIKALEDMRSKALSAIKEVLEKQSAEGGGRTFEGEHIRLTLVEDKDTEKEVFDEKAFKEDNPDLYGMYVSKKKKTTKGYVKVTLRKNPDGTPAVLGR